MAEHSSEAAIELVELIEHMINHGSSLNMNWGEDTGGYEVDWITSGKRFHGYDRSLTKAMEQAIRSAHTWNAGQQALSAKEQAVIDAAWQTHRDALNLTAQQPSDRPKTLLDGFGEATEQVVALRAENERLQRRVEVAKAVIEGSEKLIERQRAENERLRTAALAEKQSVMRKPACATCGRPAKIRRFGKSFCNPHCAAQYEAPETL